MMKSAEVRNSATMLEASAYPAVRTESVAQGTRCAVQETAAATVSSFQISNDFWFSFSHLVSVFLFLISFFTYYLYLN